jgi:hypothetical protein
MDDTSASYPVSPRPSLAGLRSALARIGGLSFPRRFPIVQFPNLPLIVAFLAGEAAHAVGAVEHPYLRSISYLAMTIWAYEELVDGVNWFRRLLGFTYATSWSYASRKRLGTGSDPHGRHAAVVATPTGRNSAGPESSRTARHLAPIRRPTRFRS